MAKTMRIQMDIKLYKNNEVLAYTTKWVKSRAVGWVTEKLNDKKLKYDEGWCKVWYDKKQDYFNHFPFTNLAQFKQGLSQVTELDLIRDIVPEFKLGKRYGN